MENQTIFELYTDDIKSKYFSNPKDIFKSAKKIMKKSTPSKTSTAATTEFLTERKYLMNTLIFVRRKYL